MQKVVLVILRAASTACRTNRSQSDEGSSERRKQFFRPNKAAILAVLSLADPCFPHVTPHVEELRPGFLSTFRLRFACDLAPLAEKAKCWFLHVRGLAGAYKVAVR